MRKCKLPKCDPDSDCRMLFKPISARGQRNVWQFGVVSLLTVFVKLRIRTSSAVYLKLRARNIFGVHPDVRNGVWCVFVCDAISQSGVCAVRRGITCIANKVNIKLGLARRIAFDKLRATTTSPNVQQQIHTIGSNSMATVLGSAPFTLLLTVMVATCSIFRYRYISRLHADSVPPRQRSGWWSCGNSQVTLFDGHVSIAYDGPLKIVGTSLEDIARQSNGSLLRRVKNVSDLSEQPASDVNIYPTLSTTEQAAAVV